MAAGGCRGHRCGEPVDFGWTNCDRFCSGCRTRFRLEPSRRKPISSSSSNDDDDTDSDRGHSVVVTNKRLEDSINNRLAKTTRFAIRDEKQTPTWPRGHPSDEAQPARRRLAAKQSRLGMQWNPCRSSSSGRSCAKYRLLVIVLLAVVSAPLLFTPPLPVAADGDAQAEIEALVPANKEKPFASMINFALINGKAKLACDIRAPTADDSVALVLWYKDDSLAPIYTIDARKVNSLERAKISVDDQYSSRLSFNARQRPALLELDQLRQDDEGDYRCRVDFKRGRTVNTVISLRIIIPPSELSIFMVRPNSASSPQVDSDDDENDMVLLQGPHRLAGANNRSLVRLPTKGMIGPFNEDSELELVCVAHGGKPRPELSWKRDFSLLNSSSNYASLDKDATSVSLRIDALHRQHLLSIFTCLASNSNLTSPLQSSLTLDLNLKPKEIMIRQLDGQQGSGPLQVGQTATFECVTTGSRPQATIHWLFQGQRHDSPMNVDQQQTSSKLSLVLQRSFNQQPLTCVAENPRISTAPIKTGGGQLAGAASGPTTKQTAIRLDVHYPPQLSVRLDKSTDKRQQVAADQAAGPATQQQQQTLTTSPSDEPAMQAATLKNFQEGNDIYLTCQMDANPRPLKPIVWRFNGRQLVSSSASNIGSSASQQNQATIVINNNSLVLRKVSRHQTGAYTCEASNQLGSNTSRPFELVIKHAPVCKTDDILVYEAAIGQQVSIDCQVLANPARSVHFSWFASYGSNQSVADWLDREAVLDEQLDNVQSQLKFRVKDANSFALIKCKAKNEIGLQQRVCLFQIVPAREPELRHSCSLASSGVQNLSLQCQLSDHLKTNQLQQWSSPNSDVVGSSGDETAARTSGGGSTSKQQDPPTWVRNYNAMRQSLAAGSGDLLGARRTQQRPRLRQIYPPDWLLVELYRAPAQVAHSGGARTAPEAGENNEKPQQASSTDYELQSYVVVGPNAQQLALVKSIVEENKLFHANPKDIYYVTTKTEHARVTPSSSKANDPAVQQDETTPAADENPLDERFELHQLDQQQQQQQHASLAIMKDAALRLPNAFNFSVPNLEPATRYKLLIYGQSLANKTRDWLVLRGETAPGQMHETPAAAQKAVKNLILDQADQADQAGANSSNQAQSKSIVMRSEQANEEQPSGGPKDQTQTTTGDQDGPTRRAELSAGLSPVGGLMSSGSKRLLERFNHYKEQALGYARQKPLMAIPLALASCLVFVLLLVYLSSFFVGLLRRSTSHSGSTNSQAHICGQSNDSTHSSSADSTTSSSNTTTNQQLSQSGQKQHRGSLVKSSPILLSDQDEAERPHSCDKKQQQSKLDMCAMPAQLNLNCDLSFSSSMASSFNGVALNSHPVGQLHHHCNQPRESLSPWECLDAVALEEHQQMLARPSWQEQLQMATKHYQGDQMLGSLDRRGRFHPATTIYLAPEEAPVHGDNQEVISLVNGIVPPANGWSRSNQNGQRIIAGGSIDRRSFASSNERNGFVLQQSQYQPLFLTTDDQQQPLAPKSRSRVRGSKSSMQSQLRVAFDLSNQEASQQQQQQNDYATGGNLAQLTKGPDSSSGSNNSTAANTADSGHESPATTGGETNSCQSGGRQRLHPRATGNGHVNGLVRTVCQKHSCNTSKVNGHAGYLPNDESCDCSHNNAAGLQQQVGGHMQVMLMEFASPSSQESSTFLQSADSSFDTTQNNNHHNVMQMESQLGPPMSTAAYLLQQNYQMATSFVGNSQSNKPSVGRPSSSSNEPESSRQADNWL